MTFKTPIIYDGLSLFGNRKERQEIKIYTGAGDRGRTSLFSGERVPKDFDRVEAYGDVDELNSVVGALVAVLPGEDTDLIGDLHQIQSDLFHVGAWLATMPESPSRALLREIGQEHVASLEKAIDRMDESLPVLRGFILPGGHISAAWSHVARTVCRRAERRVVKLLLGSTESGKSDGLERVIVYLNRLSDYLFVLARHCNLIRDVPDVLWRK